MSETNPVSRSQSKEESAAHVAPLTYGKLAAWASFFAAGVLVTLIVINAGSSEQITFSTVGLISFLFGIALSAASIVLALAAISLGKQSERIMIERSDESIRLQNEVFIKTTEAMSRIESSTGVTEKRIEDIIAGRAGAISHRIAERVAQEGVGRKGARSLEQDIRESLLSELTPAKLAASEAAERERREKEEAARAAYRKFHKQVLLSLADSPHTRTLKIGDGRFGAGGEELVDGIYTVAGLTVAVSTFSTSPSLADPFQTGFRQFVLDIARELQQKRFDRVILVFDDILAEGTEYSAALEFAKSTIRPELMEAIIVIDGSTDTALKKLDEKLAALAGA